MRVLAPQAIDEALFDKVVDVLSILNQQYDKVVFHFLHVFTVVVAALALG